MTIPEELRDITFDKSAFGYRTDDVDDYVNKATAVITALMEENQELEDKLEVLAAKIAEYKEDEDSLHSALIGAQKLGDSIVRDSKLKAEGILREANVRSERLVESALKKVETEQQNYVRIHKEVADFRNSLIAMYKSHIDLISNLPTAQPEAEKAQPAEQELPAEEPETLLQPQETAAEAPVVYEEPAAVQEAAPMPQAEPFFAEAAQPEAPVFEEEPQQPRRASRFGDLLFGQNIDIN